MNDPELEHELTAVLNRYSQENVSNTPDYILAQYLLNCLSAWNQGVQQRETWRGHACVTVRERIGRMKPCPNCGNKVPKNAKTCPSCGYKF